MALIYQSLLLNVLLFTTCRGMFIVCGEKIVQYNNLHYVLHLLTVVEYIMTNTFFVLSDHVQIRTRLLYRIMYAHARQATYTPRTMRSTGAIQRSV